MNAPTKVFVADDDPAILEVIKIILEDRGFEVLTVSEGQKILKQIEKFIPDIILLDIWMSGYDGREVSKLLKKQESTKHIPIVVISAHNDTKKMASEAEADDYLEKPFDIEVLVDTVKRNLHKS